MATSDDLESVEDYVSGDEFVNEAEIEESWNKGSMSIAGIEHN